MIGIEPSGQTDAERSGSTDFVAGQQCQVTGGEPPKNSSVRQAMATRARDGLGWAFGLGNGKVTSGRGALKRWFPTPECVALGVGVPNVLVIHPLQNIAIGHQRQGIRAGRLGPVGGPWNQAGFQFES